VIVVLKKFLRRVMREFAGWEWYEAVYLIVCTSAITVISVLLGDNALGIASAVAGTLYTLLAGKGKISCYFFGIFNSAAYGYICFENRIFGDTMLNWLWYLPMMFAGLFFWRRNLKKDVQEIIKRSLSWQGKLVTLAACGLGTAIFALILHFMGDKAPVLDAFTTVLSVIAMILTVKRCMEQWVLWTMVNIASIYMWYRVYLTGEGSAAVLMMWILSLINGILFYILWQKEVQKCPEKN
jgi:nicotinamide mononucleotide transporter